MVVSKRLDPRSATPEGPRLPGMTQYVAWWDLFWDWVAVSKRLDPGSSKLARDDASWILGFYVSGWVKLSRFLNPNAL